MGQVMAVDIEATRPTRHKSEHKKLPIDEQKNERLEKRTEINQEEQLPSNIEASLWRSIEENQFDQNVDLATHVSDIAEVTPKNSWDTVGQVFQLGQAALQYLFEAAFDISGRRGTWEHSEPTTTFNRTWDFDFLKITPKKAMEAISAFGKANVDFIRLNAVNALITMGLESA